MMYVSTRGTAPKINFSETLLTGLASDGGLYLPEQYPKLSKKDLDDLRNLSYADLAYQIMRPYIGANDIPNKDLKKIIDCTYIKDVFAFTRDNQSADDITPVTKVSNNLFMLSLSNGPTLAFKDIAMQFLGNIFEYLLNN